MKNTAKMLTAPRISEDEFFQIASRHPDLRLELVAGEVMVMPPVGGNTGRLEGAYTGELYAWSKNNSAEVYGPSTGFRLPNGNIRAADASLLLADNPAHGKAWSGYVRGCPDFLIEVRSPSDSMPRLRAKMADWITAGCRLAWLVDPVQRRVLIYEPSGYEAPVIRRADYTDLLSAADVCTGLSLQPSQLDAGD